MITVYIDVLLLEYERHQPYLFRVAIDTFLIIVLLWKEILEEIVHLLKFDNLSFNVSV